jgi:hypothetical protein
MSKYLRQKPAAEYCGVSLRTFVDWTRRRVIPVRKINRTCLYDPAELDLALNKFRRAAVGEVQTRGSAGKSSSQ